MDNLPDVTGPYVLPAAVKQFLAQHKLTIEVKDRHIENAPDVIRENLATWPRYYARILNLDVVIGKSGRHVGTIGVVGNGETQQEAVNGFVADILGQEVVVNSGTPQHYITQVPRLPPLPKLTCG